MLKTILRDNNVETLMPQLVRRPEANVAARSAKLRRQFMVCESDTLLIRIDAYDASRALLS